MEIDIFHDEGSCWWAILQWVFSFLSLLMTKAILKKYVRILNPVPDCSVTLYMTCSIVTNIGFITESNRFTDISNSGSAISWSSLIFFFENPYLKVQVELVFSRNPFPNHLPTTPPEKYLIHRLEPQQTLGTWIETRIWI